MNRLVKWCWRGLILKVLDHPRSRSAEELSFSLKLEILEQRIALDGASAGFLGINSQSLMTPDRVALTGEGVGIGQAEPDRPGKPGFDNAANSHPAVRPQQVYLRTNA